MTRARDLANFADGTIGDVSGNLTGNVNGYTPQASNMQPFNRIINGAMTIDQRNAGAAVTVNTGNAFYCMDRYFGAGTSSAGVFTVQQSSTVPVGFNSSALITVTTSATPSGTDNYRFNQAIEGLNVADLNWGSSNAQAVTLSFWVRSSLTGTFGGALQNSDKSRTYPFSYTISSANTWEQKTITVAGDTTGTWLTTNGIGVLVIWCLGAADRLGTANAWSSTRYDGVTGQVNLISTSGATFYITGVQLEAGSFGSSFAHENVGDTLRKCQRYFQLMTNGVSGKAVSGGGGFYSAAIASCPTPLKVTMRATPTISSNSGTNYWAIFNNSASTLFNAFGGIIGEATADIAGAYVSGLSRTAGHYGYFISNNASAFLAFQAEL